MGRKTLRDVTVRSILVLCINGREELRGTAAYLRHRINTPYYNALASGNNISWSLKYNDDEVACFNCAVERFAGILHALDRILSKEA